MRLVRACIAMAAFTAIFVVPSVASASPELTHPTGTTVPKGTPITATNVAHAGTPAFGKLALPGGGAVECATATMTGEVHANAGNDITGNITTVEFKGETNPVNHNTADCSSPLGKVQVTPNHTTNPTHNGVGSLPWCIRANTPDDTFTVRGGSCTEVSRPITFTLHVTGVTSCSYQKASVGGTYTTHPNVAILTVSGEKFTKTTGSIFCPNEGTLTLAFTLETDNEKKEDLYIS